MSLQGYFRVFLTIACEVVPILLPWSSFPTNKDTDRFTLCGIPDPGERLIQGVEGAEGDNDTSNDDSSSSCSSSNDDDNYVQLTMLCFACRFVCHQLVLGNLKQVYHLLLPTRLRKQTRRH
jgi:hypothetical protein